MITIENVTLQAPIQYVSREDTTIQEHVYRTPFMRDRDRIMYCKAFRRLAGKTQVLKATYDDHVRNRLTHTLEVAQIARTISRELNLNEELTEAIALGHDLGHSPFGHAGEEFLNKMLTNKCSFTQNSLETALREKIRGIYGFKHNLQSVRVVTEIESSNDQNKQGLNLTNYTLFGLMYHSKLKSDIEILPDYYKKYFDLMKQKGSSNFAWSFEAYIVEIADEIAQRHHDLEDAIDSEILSEKEICILLSLKFDNYFSELEKESLKQLSTNSAAGPRNKSYFNSNISRFLVNFFVTRLIQSSKANLNKLIVDRNLDNSNYKEFYNDFSIRDSHRFISYTLINKENGFKEAEKQFSHELKNLVIKSYDVQKMDIKGAYILEKIARAYYKNPQQIPDNYVRLVLRELQDREAKNYSLAKLREVFSDKADNLIEDRDYEFNCVLLRVICDYISGMTDKFAFKQYEALYH